MPKLARSLEARRRPQRLRPLCCPRMLPPRRARGPCAHYGRQKLLAMVDRAVLQEAQPQVQRGRNVSENKRGSDLCQRADHLPTRGLVGGPIDPEESWSDDHTPMYSHITPKVPKAPGPENADRAGRAAYRRDLTKFRTNDCALRLVHAALALPNGLSRIQIRPYRCPQPSGCLSYEPSATTAGAKGAREGVCIRVKRGARGTSDVGTGVREHMDQRRPLHRIP